MKYTIKYNVLKEKTKVIESNLNEDDFWDMITHQYDGFNKDPDGDVIANDEELKLYSNGELLAQY